MDEHQPSGTPVPAAGSGLPSGAGSAVRSLTDAVTTAPPDNLPMVAEPAGALVPPSAANPTIPRTPPPKSDARKKLAPPPMSIPVVPVASEEEPTVVSATEPTASAQAPAALTPALEASIPAISPPSSTDASDLELPQLSEVSYSFLTSRRYRQNEAALAKEFDLTTDDLSFLNEMDHLVLGGTIKLDGYVRALRTEFPAMAPEKKTAMLGRLLAERFLPWGEELKPSAVDVSRKEKITLPSVPYYAVYVKPLTFSGAAGEVARTADLPSGAQIRERLRDLVLTRSKGVRLDAQVEEQIMRPLDLGGLGLEREKARVVTQIIADIISRARLLTEDEYTNWLTMEARRKADAARPATASIPEDDDGKEIAAIAANMPKPVRDTSSVLALSTQTILNRLSIKPEGAYLMGRLENIISTRLRDVRSRNEVMLKLVRDAKVGGVGMSRADAEKLATQIEEGYEEFRMLIAQEEKEKLDTLSLEQGRKVEERKRREAEDHARWFQEKIQGKRQQDEDKKQLIERMRVVAQGLTTPITLSHPMDVKEQAREKASFGELVPATPQTAPVVAAAAPKEMPKIVTPSASSLKPPAMEAPMRELKPLAPMPVVKVSAESARAAQAESGMLRPRMDDVKVIRTRLSGPMQELEGLTLISFRRLGKTATEAAAKLEQKIELLSQESFERRVEAIRAWQASPLQKAYLGLVAESFSKGLPVKTLAEQKRVANEEVLTPEELSAIVALNGKLHF